MDILIFILKYTPFWAIPLMMISLEFGYVYWLKSYRDIAKSFLTVAVICIILIIYYIYVGGPQGVVDNVFGIQEQIK